MKKYFYLLLLAMPLLFVACSSDDDDEPSVSKSELVGTWYTLEDDWVLVFTETNVTQYEIWKSSGVYSLNSYTITSKYTLSGNKIIDEEGRSSVIAISGNTLKLVNGNETLTYTKFNGTPNELINYLNR